MPPAEVVWSRPLHLRSSAAAVSPGTVVVAERHTRLVRLDARTGRRLWDHPVEDCHGTAVVAGGHCLYLSRAGVLHRLDPDTGRPLWQRPGLRLRHHVTVSGDDVLVGGWRGYHPLTRLSLATGEPLPFDGTALRGLGALAPPLPLPGTPAVLVAGAGRPVLLLLAAGVVLARWTLPEPVAFPDTGDAHHVGDDGDVTFLSGRRTVMACHPDRGVRVLWRHHRDLAARAPLRDARTLWLVDEAGIAVADLDAGVVREVDHRRHGPVTAAAQTSGGAVFAFADGALITLDRTGNAGARTRVRGRADRLFAREAGLVHALAKGHLVTVRFPAGDDGPGQHHGPVVTTVPGQHI